MCVFKLSETTWPTEAKFHVASPWDRAKDGKLIHLLLFIDVNPRGAGTLSRDFTTRLAPQCRALKIQMTGA